jgi:hypothetical protein
MTAQVSAPWGTQKSAARRDVHVQTDGAENRRDRGDQRTSRSWLVGCRSGIAADDRLWASAVARNGSAAAEMPTAPASPASRAARRGRYLARRVVLTQCGLVLF